MMDLLTGISEQLDYFAQVHSIDPEQGAQLRALFERLASWTAGGESCPVIAASAPSGIALVSNDNALLGAQTRLDLLSAEDLQIAAGRNVYARALKNLSLFAHQSGIKLVAAGGDILIQAHNGDIELTATGRIRITSGKEIELQAPEVKIATKGAQANFGGNVITQQCAGAYSVKAENFEFKKGGKGSAPEVNFANTAIETDERIILYHSQTREPVQGRRYSIRLPDGSCFEGVTDAQGRTELITSVEFGDLDVTIFPLSVGD